MRADPLPSALVLGLVMAGWTRVTGVVLSAISATANGILRVFRVQPTSELCSTYTAEDLGQLVDESAAHGLLRHDDRLRLQQALALDTQTLAGILIPLDGLVTLGPQPTVGELRRLVSRSGYSRFPVRCDDRLSGYVHAKEVLGLDRFAADAALPDDSKRAMTEMPADTNMTTALEAMTVTSTHMAVVTTAGAHLGVVTLEDVLTHLLGKMPENGTD
jgi:CBS domain containing-hemolysin-like protein